MFDRLQRRNNSRCLVVLYMPVRGLYVRMSVDRWRPCLFAYLLRSYISRSRDVCVCVCVPDTRQSRSACR